MTEVGIHEGEHYVFITRLRICQVGSQGHTTLLINYNLGVSIGSRYDAPLISALIFV